jgi:hypothetical protein
MLKKEEFNFPQISHMFSIYLCRIFHLQKIENRILRNVLKEKWEQYVIIGNLDVCRYQKLFKYLRFLCWLQGNDLAYQIFMDTERRHVIPSSITEDFISYCIASSVIFNLSVLFIPSLREVTQSCPIEREEVRLKMTISFIRVIKPTESIILQCWMD